MIAHSMKEVKWHGLTIMVGDTVIGRIENWEIVDKKDLPEVCELSKLNPIEFIPSTIRFGNIELETKFDY